MNWNILYGSLYISAALLWGDIKNWKAYYPTILFVIGGDLMYQFIFHDYRMWEYVPVGPDKKWASHAHLSLLIMFIKYPATVMVYLANFPKTKLKASLYFFAWVFLYTANELIDLWYGGMVHHHGWNTGWSILFNIVMFAAIRVHFKRPLSAWAIAIPFIFILWSALNVPYSILK